MLIWVYLGLCLMYTYYYTTNINPNVEAVIVEKKVVTPADYKYDSFAYWFLYIMSPALAPFILLYSTFQYMWYKESRYIPTKLIQDGFGGQNVRQNNRAA